jgi:hypothetical protein
LLREFAEKSCGKAVSCSNIVALRPEIVIFPVKFPVCREFGWRPVRSALRRQPGIPASGKASWETRDWAGNPSFSRSRFRFQTPSSLILERQPPKVSGHLREYSRFAETTVESTESDSSVQSFILRKTICWNDYTRVDSLHFERLDRQGWKVPAQEIADDQDKSALDCFAWHCRIGVPGCLCTPSCPRSDPGAGFAHLGSIRFHDSGRDVLGRS